MTTTSGYEAVVIGGGIVGAALVHYLARAGMRDVVLVERDKLGSGTTGNSAGGIRQQFTTALEIEMSRRGLAFWRGVERNFDSPCPFHAEGYLLLTGQESIADEMRSAAALQRAMGLPNVHLLAPEQIANAAPWINPQGLLVGSWTPDDGHVTPTDGVAALAKSARSMGVEIREDWEVTEVRRRTDGWEVVGPQTLRAARVIVASGYWTADLVRPFGVEIDIRVNRRYVGISERALVGQPVPFTIDVDTGFCVEREGDALRLNVLGRNPAPSTPTDMLAAFAERAAVRAPALAELKVAKIIQPNPASGGDGMPFVGEIERGLWTICFVGHGAMHGPPVAEVVARAIAGTPDHSVDLAPWDPRRVPAKVDTVWWRRPPPNPN